MPMPLIRKLKAVGLLPDWDRPALDPRRTLMRDRVWSGQRLQVGNLGWIKKRQNPEH
jgi:hypothetical protein